MTTKFWPRNIGDLLWKNVVCEWQATRLGEPHGLSIWGFPEIGPIATAQAVPPAPKRVARSAFDEGTAMWMLWVLAKNSRVQHGKEGGGWWWTKETCQYALYNYLQLSTVGIVKHLGVGSKLENKPCTNRTGLAIGHPISDRQIDVFYKSRSQLCVLWRSYNDGWSFKHSFMSNK
jgi:hypothetical protein